MAKSGTQPKPWKNRIVDHAVVKAAKLIANDKNWREHSAQQKAAMSAIFSTVGWVQDVVVNKTTNRILDGHMRVQMAKGKGEQVPVTYVAISKDEEEFVLSTFDPIGSMATANEEMLKTLLTNIDLTDDLKTLFEDFDIEPNQTNGETEEPSVDLQAAAQYRKKWKTEKQQLWSMGQHKLLIGDSRDAENYKKLLNGEKAQMIYTDPPYGVSYISRSGKFQAIKNDSLVGDKLLKFLISAFRPMVACADDSAAFYIWHASSTRSEFQDAMKAVGLMERQYIIWVKPAAVMGWGDYRWQHEPCFYAAKQGQEVTFYGDRTNTTVWYAKTHLQKEAAACAIGQGILLSDGEGHELYALSKPPKNKKTRKVRISKGQTIYLTGDDETHDVWHVGREHMPEHPTEKPSELARRAIENSTAPGDIVVDIFAGSGRMMVAAEQTERRALMMELTPEYGGVILETAHKMGLKPELLNG